MEAAAKPSPQQPGVKAPVMESGEDQGDRIIIVTPKREFVTTRREFVYHIQTVPVEETRPNATSELVCK